MKPISKSARSTRRGVLGASVGGAVIVATGASAQTPAYPEPGLEFAFQIDVALGPVQEIGVIDGVRRRIVPIVGGTVSGPMLTGMVMPGGADWQGVRPDDGLTRVFAHYWLKTTDGAVISVQNSGVRRAPAEVMKRLMAGEAVAPADYYFRATPVFEASGGPYQWLNETVFVCVGARLPDKAILRVYRVT